MNRLAKGLHTHAKDPGSPCQSTEDYRNQYCMCHSLHIDEVGCRPEEEKKTN